MALEQKRTQGPVGKRRDGGPPLVQYRLYFLQGPDMHISYSHEFEAEDDKRAVRVAESWREGRAAELWAGARKVMSWETDR